MQEVFIPRNVDLSRYLDISPAFAHFVRVNSPYSLAVSQDTCSSLLPTEERECGLRLLQYSHSGRGNSLLNILA